MPASKDDQSKKVFDVAKPGKSAPSASGRPVIIGHKNMLKDPMVKDNEVSDLSSTEDQKSSILPPEDKPSGGPMLPPNADEAEPTTAPTVSRIKILPISDSKKSNSSKEEKPEEKTSEEDLTKMEEGESITVSKKSAPEGPAEIEDSIGDESTEEPTKEDEPEKPTEEAEPEKEPEQEEPKPEESSEKEETDTKTEESSDNDTKEKSEVKPKEDTLAQESSSDSAEVETVAATAQTESDKKMEKEAQELAAKKTAVDKLVTEKKYFVPIGEKKRRRNNLKWVLFLFLFILLAAGVAYLLIDAGIIKANIDLPYHIFKQESESTTSNSIPTVTTTPTTTTTKPAVETITMPTVQYVKPTGWTVKEETGGSGTSKYKKITLTSSNYTTTQAGECAITKTGRVITIYISYNKTTNEKYISDLLKADPTAITSPGNVKATTLGGQKAVQYTSSPGECEASVSTSTIVDNYQVDVSTEMDSKVKTAPYLIEPYKTVYNNLLSSVKFKTE